MSAWASPLSTSKTRSTLIPNRLGNATKPFSCLPQISCPATPGEFIWNVPCSAATLSSRLSLFSEWRGTVSEDGNGLWHLMSGCPTGAEVGIAWLATM